MKMFLWEKVDELTDRYHSEGGLVIIAEDLSLAKRMMPEGCEALEKEPDYVVGVETEVSNIFIFPDSGCC